MGVGSELPTGMEENFHRVIHVFNTMKNPMRQFSFKMESQPAELLPTQFGEWLEIVLQTEQGRAQINARMQRHELPVIDLEPA